MKLFIALLTLIALSIPRTSLAEISDDEYNNLVNDLSSGGISQLFSNLSGPEDFTNIWNHYHDNGSPEIVERIIQLLDDTSYTTGNPQVDNIIRTLAEVSLKAQAGQFGEVRNIIIERANSLPNGQLKTKLVGIINALQNPEN